MSALGRRYNGVKDSTRVLAIRDMTDAQRWRFLILFVRAYRRYFLRLAAKPHPTPAEARFVKTYVSVIGRRAYPTRRKGATL